MRRILLAATLAAVLAPSAGSTFLDPFWSFFSSLWSRQAVYKEGCGFDPDGRCRPASQIQPDEGCGADPSGRCHAAAQIQPDEGCGFDPSGRCQPGS